MNPKTYKEASERMVEDAFLIGNYDLCVLVEDIDDNSFWRCIIEHA